MRYIITTPGNLNYNGTTFHVQFKDGRAVIDEYTLPNKPNFHPTLEQLAGMFRNDLAGYLVESTVSDVPASAIADEPGEGLPAAAEPVAPKPTKATKKAAGRVKVAED